MAKNLVNGTNIVVEENSDNINLNLTSTYSTALETRLSNIETNVANITGQILWTNPTPTGEITSATTITLSSSDYDILEIFYVQKSDANLAIFSSRFLKSSTGTRLFVPSTDGIIYRVITKNSDTSLTINAMTNSPNGHVALPLYIIGYKTGLWG